MTQTTFVVDELLADARAANEGLTHFGEPDLRPALDKLCASLEHDARLSDMGRYLLRQKIVTQLGNRSEEHTSELQSLMRISYAVFCLQKKKHKHTTK